MASRRDQWQQDLAASLKSRLAVARPKLPGARRPGSPGRAGSPVSLHADIRSWTEELSHISGLLTDYDHRISGVESSLRSALQVENPARPRADSSDLRSSLSTSASVEPVEPFPSLQIGGGQIGSPTPASLYAKDLHARLGLCSSLDARSKSQSDLCLGRPSPRGGEGPEPGAAAGPEPRARTPSRSALLARGSDGSPRGSMLDDSPRKRVTFLHGGDVVPLKFDG